MNYFSRPSILGDDDDDTIKNGCVSTLIIFSCLVIIGVVQIYSNVFIPNNKNEKYKVKGIITKKLPNDKLIIKTNKNEDVYIISDELYINKNVGDSIKLINKN